MNSASINDIGFISDIIVAAENSGTDNFGRPSRLVLMR